jgi:hypothetical protein
VICGSCGKVLEKGGPEVVKKTCVSCVMGKTKRADLSKLMTPQGRAKAKKKTIDTVMESLQSMSLEIGYVEQNKKNKVMFTIKNHFGNPFFEFALDKDQIFALLHDLDVLDAKKD